MNNCWVRIWGIGLQDISQAQYLPNQPFSMMGGMSTGLPLANPGEAGPLGGGTIYQAFGNWIGTEQTLDIISVASSSSPAPAQGSGGPNPVPVTSNLVMNWPKGQDITGPLQQALQQAYSRPADQT